MRRLQLLRKANIISKKIFYLSFFLFQISESVAQTAWPSEDWASAVNLTGVIDPNGLTELSGLHWNPLLHRLYVIDNAGNVKILFLNTATNKFSQIADKFIAGGPEGITQVDYNENEFYTLDENNYEIRKYTHSADFSNLALANYWSLLVSPSPMQNTGNSGSEGIAFVPDSFLKAIGFKSQVTGLLSTSAKGMGGLIFIAHQDLGYVWVFDLNPNTTNDFAYVGKYKTNRTESCDLEFDRSTGLLYILHNTGSNTLEVTDLSSTFVTGGRKFTLKKEYNISNPAGNINIEGFALTPKCIDSLNVGAWLCRDVSGSDNTIYQKDCLRWFQPFSSYGTCAVNTDVGSGAKRQYNIITYPNPANEMVSFSESLNDIQVYNIFGELVINTTGSSNSLITSNLSEGIYLLKSKMRTVRFIVRH